MIGDEKTVYFECNLGGPVTFGSLSYITDVLGFMNLRSIYSNVAKEWLYPDFDFVIEMDPDVVIIEPKMFAKRAENLVEKMVKDRGWDELAAFKNGRIYVTPGKYDFFAHHGPSLIREVLPWLERIQ